MKHAGPVFWATLYILWQCGMLRVFSAVNELGLLNLFYFIYVAFLKFVMVLYKLTGSNIFGVCFCEVAVCAGVATFTELAVTVHGHIGTPQHIV